MSYVRWECKDQIAILPKYRRKVTYRKRRRLDILHLVKLVVFCLTGEHCEESNILTHRHYRILRDLCEQEKVEVWEGYAISDDSAIG